jgi:hypothetical protein
MAANDGKKANSKARNHFFIALKNTNRQAGNADFFQPIRRTPDKLLPVHSPSSPKITISSGSVHSAYVHAGPRRFARAFPLHSRQPGFRQPVKNKKFFDCSPLKLSVNREPCALSGAVVPRAAVYGGIFPRLPLRCRASEPEPEFSPFPRLTLPSFDPSGGPFRARAFGVGFSGVPSPPPASAGFVFPWRGKFCGDLEGAASVRGKLSSANQGVNKKICIR